MPSTPVAAGADRGQQLRCPYCHDVITHDDTAAACKVCRAPHHADCWYEGWGCSCCRHLEARHVAAQRTHRTPWCMMCIIAGKCSHFRSSF